LLPPGVHLLRLLRCRSYGRDPCYPRSGTVSRPLAEGLAALPIKDEVRPKILKGNTARLFGFTND
jgi:predicted TIM-barrel fold metal-dependent hydrolase